VSRRARRKIRVRENRLRARIRTALDLAVRESIPEAIWKGGPRASVCINYGSCDIVAETARDYLWSMGISALVLMDDNELAGSTHPKYGDTEWTHAWLWVEGNHYDSEAIGGVDHWLDLPHFKRWAEDETWRPQLTLAFPPGEERRALFRNASLLRRWLRSSKFEA